MREKTIETIQTLLQEEREVRLDELNEKLMREDRDPMEALIAYQRALLAEVEFRREHPRKEDKNAG